MTRGISRAPNPRWPPPAIVGQDGLRLALVLSAVSPAVGEVLVRGEKGTAKSTMVRALAALLSAVEGVDECLFSWDPTRRTPVARMARTHETATPPNAQTGGP